jgi:hypothetical protein
MRDPHGDWHSYLGNEGVAVDALATGNMGFNDLAIGVPGFQYPVFSWNGKDYVRTRNIADADFLKVKHADIQIISKNLYKK